MNITLKMLGASYISNKFTLSTERLMLSKHGSYGTYALADNRSSIFLLI